MTPQNFRQLAEKKSTGATQAPAQRPAATARQDAVLHLDDGRYALIEFKLGGSEIDMGAKHLLEIRELIRKKNEKGTQLKMREPDLLLIITGGPIAYTRPDGVKVIPLACLKD